MPRKKTYRLKAEAEFKAETAKMRAAKAVRLAVLLFWDGRETAR